MKWTFLLIFLSAPLLARPLVLISYYDPFGRRAKTNNSTTVALALAERFKDSETIDLRLCSLNTVFDKSFHQLEACVSSGEKIPDLLIGLGETGCRLKIETMARNFDKTIGPDNEGNERRNTVIITGGPEAMGFNYPLLDMFCALPGSLRLKLKVSNNAGSFVCNNTAYQMSYHYPNIRSGFIHVPSHRCRNLEAKNKLALNTLESMIIAGAVTSGFDRLPVFSDEIEERKMSSRDNQCHYDFFKKMKGID